MSNVRKYKAVIFDWDGTLMNSEARIVNSIQSAARACGFPVLSNHDSKQIIGLSLENAILGLYPDTGSAQLASMSQAYTQHFLEQSDVPMQLFDGAESLLFNLKQHGLKLAIATGKSRRGLDQVLSECGFGIYFDMTRTPVESASKPNPLMLEQILMEFGLSVDEAVMVGDTTFDMEMAQNIGMDRIALSHGVHHMDLLTTYNPVAELDSLQALNLWLMQNG